MDASSAEDRMPVSGGGPKLEHLAFICLQYSYTVHLAFSDPVIQEA